MDSVLIYTFGIAYTLLVFLLLYGFILQKRTKRDCGEYREIGKTLIKLLNIVSRTYSSAMRRVDRMFSFKHVRIKEFGKHVIDQIVHIRIFFSNNVVMQEEYIAEKKGGASFFLKHITEYKKQIKKPE